MSTDNSNSSPYSAPETPKDQSVSPGLLVDTLRHHPLIIIGTTVLVLLAVYVYVSRMTPLYMSAARLYVDKEIPDAVYEATRGVMTKPDNYLYTHATLLKSTRVLANALESLDTEKMLHTFGDVTNPMSVLYNGLEATVGKTDGIINVSFKAPHPQEAADIVNAVVDGYVAFNAEHQRETAAALLGILEKERVVCDGEVAEKYQRVLAFRQQNEALAYGSDETTSIIMRQMDNLLTQLSEAKAETRQLKYFYDTVQSMSEESSAVRRLLETRRNRSVTDTTLDEIVSLRAEMARLEGNKADILLELKPEHPAIATLDMKIKQVQERIGELEQLFVRNQLEILHQEYLAAKVREEELAQQCEVQRQKVLSLNGLLARLDALQSDYHQAKQSLDSLDQHMKQLNVTKQVGGLNVTVLESAWAAVVPSEPKKVRLMAIALIIGFCAGVALGLMRELFDQKLGSCEEISELLKLPVLGAIPAMKAPMHSAIVRAKMTRVNPTSVEAEAFRRLRAPLLLGTLHQKARTVLVTSPTSGDGKTTIVSNLGLALARAGKKVLILDADCHAPRQHKIFKINRQRKGLSSVLAGEMSLEEAIEPTGIDNLDILTCGPEVASPTEMLSTDRLRGLIAALSDRYDRVLIDSPPILCCTDAQILAAQCDGTVLVVHAETSTRKDSVQAYGELAAVDAQVLGVVINATPRNHSSYHYNGYYSHKHAINTIPVNEEKVRNAGSQPFVQLFEREEPLTNTKTDEVAQWDKPASRC